MIPFMAALTVKVADPAVTPRISPVAVAPSTEVFDDAYETATSDGGITAPVVSFTVGTSCCV